MERREISIEQFDAMAAELVDVARYPSVNFTMLSGQHRECGHVVLLRTRSVAFALVDEPGKGMRATGRGRCGK